MKEYTFTIDQMTIGDGIGIIAAWMREDTHAVMVIIDRYTVGGVLQLPYAEMGNVGKQFADAFVVFVKSAASPTTSDVARLLRQALGGEEAE